MTVSPALTVSAEETVLSVQRDVSTTGASSSAGGTTGSASAAMADVIAAAAATATTVFVPLAWTEDVTSFTTISAPRALLKTTLNVAFIFDPFVLAKTN